MKVSVIVPFYNVEAFIEHNAISLLSQTLDDVEFIFVDDASPDGSRKKLEYIVGSFPGREVRIITHTVNKGLPAARNTGLSVARGDFIYHCDSDDWLEKDMLEKMYETAIKERADFVYCDYWMQFEKRERYMHNPTFSDPKIMVKEGFFSGQMKYNVWNKLLNRDLYNSQVLFPEGHSMGEDMTMILLASHANKIAHLPEALYHYLKTNNNAFTSKYSSKDLEDLNYNASRILEAYKDDDEMSSYLSFFKLNVKLPFLFTDEIQQYELWKEWYPEANEYALSNYHLPFRTRLIQWFASKNLFLFNRIYVFFVNKMYKMRYR